LTESPQERPRARTAGARRRRSDAERSIARILDAAVEALADDPDASVGEIARRAAVVRATVYVHFPTREHLIAAATERAVEAVTRAMEEAEPDSGDAETAMRRVLRAAWRELGRFHALVGINAGVPPAELQRRHGPALDLLRPLIERGQAERVFRSDLPVRWHLTMLLALVHAASAEVEAGHVRRGQGEDAVADTVLAALAAPRRENG
jgi:AcrR family transcriptional regulator